MNFSMDFVRTERGVSRHISGTERVKDYTRSVRTHRVKPAPTSRSKVFFTVESSGEVKCWPYADFYKLWKKMHFSGLRLAQDAEMAGVARASDVAGANVRVPMSGADMLIHGITSSIVNSTKRFVKKAKEENHHRRVVAASNRAIKPKKTVKKIRGKK